MMQFRLFIILACVVAPAIADAQTRSSSAFVHESWTARDGLPINSIPHLRQSRSGYLWLATFDGLVRFDGVRFTVFNTANSPGLPTNRVVRIYETRDMTLWLVTESGELVRLRDGRFTTIAGTSGIFGVGEQALHEDRNGMLWVGTPHGIGVVRGDSLVRVASGLITRVTGGFAEAPDGSLYVTAAPAGLYRIRNNIHVAVANASALLESPVLALAADSAGSVWIGTATSLFKYDGALERIPLPNDGARMWFTAVPQRRELWGSTRSGMYRIDARGVTHVFGPRRHFDAAMTLAYDPRGSVWYSSGPEVFRDGVHVDHPGLAATNAVAVGTDHEGSVWLGTTSSGLHRLKPALFSVFSKPEGLIGDNVYYAATDRSGAVWTSGWGGISRIANGAVTTFRPPGEAMGSVPIFEDSKGRLWFGDAVCRIATRDCTRQRATPIAAFIRAIHEDDDSTIWFGTDDGLHILRNDQWTRLAEANGAPAKPVRVFARTQDGALWLGTNGGGLSRYHNGRFTHVTRDDGLPGNLVRALYVDAKGFLWIGTEGMGLARIDPREWNGTKRGGRIVNIRRQDGLFHDGIHQILADTRGRVWMSSNGGIFWVSSSDLDAFAADKLKRVRSIAFDERHGLRNREANGGGQPAGARTPDGRLWFATQDGLAVIDPRALDDRAQPPHVVVERVVAGGTALDISAPLELNRKQRDLEIDYTALTFLSPENVRFRYRLAGYDDEWIDADTRRTAYYTRVPPGRYRFEVAASNSAGEWSPQAASLGLFVKPLFYETRWFAALFLLLAGALVWVGVRWRIARLRAVATELQVRVDERTAELRERESQLALQNTTLANQADQLMELDRAKSRFFANASHEFRTPLTLTIGPLEDARAQLADTEHKGAVASIDMALRSARRLFGLVTQVLDVAKLEAGRMKLHARPADLVVFTRGIAATFTSLADRKRITFDVSAPVGEVMVWLDPDAMEKVLTNLLSNAFKFTPDGGRIVVSVEGGDSNIARVRVSDSGPGIPVAHLPHVFERFYQVDESNTRAQPGTGIGLSLALELVELHGGKIVAASGATMGATFTVTLPLGRAHLRDDQVVDAASDWQPATSATADLEEATAPLQSAGGEDVTTLLVVDDSADMRAYIRARFDARYRVLEAADGEEGVAAARASLPDLVISDVMMPVMDGHALCTALRASPETDFIPIILLTAQAESEQRIAGLDRGADDYITKPFDMRELEARVENMIATRRRLRERFGATTVQLKTDVAEDLHSPADRAFLDRLTKALDANLADPDFGVAELADAVFQDRSHLFRRTKELLNETPSELLRRVRLERAQQLLREGEDGIADIAYGVGFNSVSAFCRAFKEEFSVTPSAFRAEARSGTRN